MKKISFRPFIVFALLAALVVIGGVVVYWQQVNTLLERDVKINIAQASQEAALNFSNLLKTDHDILTANAISLEDAFPWKKDSFLPETLARYAQNDHFHLLGVVLKNGKTFYSNPSTRPLSPAVLQAVLQHTSKDPYYVNIFPREAGKYNSAILVQAIALNPTDKSPVGALFAIQKEDYYQGVLALSAMGAQGNSFIIRKDGSVILSFGDQPFTNVFSFLEQKTLDIPLAFTSLRKTIEANEPALMGYRDMAQAHYFLQFVPLPVNGWYLVSSIPAHYIEEQATQVAKLSLILFIVVFFVFYGLIFLIMRMREESNRQLFATAFVDPLTGADNFNRMCEQFNSKLAGLNRQAALVIFDINKFKVINDLHGYERGNEVLKRVAHVLRAEVAAQESFCRLSADNFILLLSYQDRPSLLKRLHALAVELKRNCTVEDSCLMLDVAFGIYEITDEPLPFYIMLDRAHLALEHAKTRTLDKCEFYDAQDRRRLVAEQRIEATMEAALESGEFAIHLQPKCDFVTGEIRGAEALVRWNQGERTIRPDEFIPLFERNGFILKLDMFILEQVARLLAGWKERGIEPVPLAVNFSRLHLNDARFIPQMRCVMAEYNLPSKLIEAEITESVIFNNLERAKEVIDGLHLYGFPVAMDDFGSGYSSLNVLKDLKFDSIKLDKEFLSGFEKNPRAQKVIEQAVRMIKSLDIKVITEGVETREQADFLRTCGADLAQGYFFSRPVTIDVFEQLLLKKKLL